MKIMKKFNVLWISLCAPYEKVNHAGGKTLNYYLSQFEADKDFQIKLVTFCSSSERDELIVDRKCEIEDIVLPKGIKKFAGNVLSINSKCNPWYKYGNGLSRKLAKLLIKRLKHIRDNGYMPDIVIMEWTEIVLYIDIIKKIFPYSYFIASEHDVTFVRKRREMLAETKKISRLYKLIVAKNTQKIEIEALKKCDLVVVHNRKDIKRLYNKGISKEKLHAIIPYYHRSKIPYRRANNNIIFWGNMTRRPNQEAARWLAEKVMPLLHDIDCKFYILGVGGKTALKDIAAERIIPVGFIDDIDRWFSESMCFVAPITLGAGIKVKCLEALYSGIPVLANHMGMEGIPALDGRDYINCSSKEEYSESINRLISEEKCSICGKDVVLKYFNMEKSFVRYKVRIVSLIN